MVSIFVNPAQFAPSEDFSTYPAHLRRPTLRCWREEKADLVWAPANVAVMYPEGFATRIVPEGPATAGLEDAFRPDFFKGVATVVAKLFTQVAPDIAVFGEKDYQQLKVVTRMARDLDLPLRVIGAPTVRETDGLAMSSRNVYLSADERAVAPVLHRVLTLCAQKIAEGPSDRDDPGGRPRGDRARRALRSTISKRATPRRWRRSRRSRTGRSGCWWRRSSGRRG